MNPIQRIVLGLGATIIAAMVMFPPWVITYNPPSDFLYVQKATRPAGYHVIVSPPVAEDAAELARMFGLPSEPPNAKPPSVLSLNYFSITIDKDRLMVQLAGALAVTALMAFLFRDFKYERRPKPLKQPDVAIRH